MQHSSIYPTNARGTSRMKKLKPIFLFVILAVFLNSIFNSISTTTSTTTPSADFDTHIAAENYEGLKNSDEGQSPNFSPTENVENDLKHVDLEEIPNSKHSTELTSPEEYSNPLTHSILSEDKLSETKDFEVVIDPPLPEIAWLMSFPNSGTSYTLRMVRRATSTTTATNYGREKNYDGPSLSYHPLHDNGPFLHKIDLDVPSTYILTKTHCGGFCSGCAPKSYIMSKEEFLEACLSGKSEDEYGIRTPISYEAGLVKKAVYLLRNPFDNIVSRFHLIHNDYVKKKKKGSKRAIKWLEKHPRNEEGFKTWCSNIDEKYKEDEKTSFPAVVQFPGILCQSEFIKYIQWHNLASEILEDLNIPTQIIYYEDYKSHFNETLDATLGHLELPKIGELAAFHLSNYETYYSLEQRKQATRLMQYLASSFSTQKIARYINPS